MHFNDIYNSTLTECSKIRYTFLINLSLKLFPKTKLRSSISAASACSKFYMTTSKIVNFAIYYVKGIKSELAHANKIF